MSTSIVIPAYSRWDLLHTLLYDLYKNCSLIEEVVVVDNGNDGKYPDVISGLAWWKSTNMLPLEIISLKDNIGFLKASNLGLKAAVEDNVILISTDVRVHKDITEFMKDTQPQSIVGGRLIDWDSGWNTFNGVTYPYLEGYILGATNKAWQELDYFDELFAPHDMEDVDFSAKAVKWDYNLVTFPDGYVTHLGAQTIGYGDERENITKINKEKFGEKWTQLLNLK